MRILIFGSTKFAALGKVREYVIGLDKGTEIVVPEGNNPVALTAHVAAAIMGNPMRVFTINKALKSGANDQRQRAMVDYCDEAVIFWDGKSEGTARLIGMARNAGKLKKVIYDELRAGTGIGRMDDGAGELEGADNGVAPDEQPHPID